MRVEHRGAIAMYGLHIMRWWDRSARCMVSIVRLAAERQRFLHSLKSHRTRRPLRAAGEPYLGGRDRGGEAPDAPRDRPGPARATGTINVTSWVYRRYISTPTRLTHAAQCPWTPHLRSLIAQLPHRCKLQRAAWRISRWRLSVLVTGLGHQRERVYVELLRGRSS